MAINWNKLWPTIALSLATTFLGADNPEDTVEIAILSPDSDLISRNRECRPPKKVVQECPPCIQGSNYFFYGELLVWQAHESGLPIAIDNYDSNNGVTLNNGQTKNIDFDWDLGFRVGFDAKLGNNGWDLDLCGLRFYTDADRHLNTHDTTHQLYPTQTHPADALLSLGSNAAQMKNPLLVYFINNGANNNYSQANAHWHAHLNQIDLVLGRAFDITKWLTLRPNFGARTTWIQQALKVSYKSNNTISQIFQVDPILPAANPLLFDLESFQSPADEFTVKKKNRWWGLGPEAGLDTAFNLGCGFKLFGNFTVAIEYGFHETSDKDRDTTQFSTNFNIKDSFRTSHPILDVEMGLGWSHEFCRRYTLSLIGMWEQHIYFSQNQFPYFVDSKSQGTFTTNNSDLTYQGFTFAVRFGF
jgi:hypothetical protein